MKKAIFSLAILVALVVACTPKASPAVTEATIPTAAAVSKNEKAIEAGHTLFTTKCTRCHKAKPVEKWTYDELRPVLASMVKKAKLNTTETEQVSAYVYAHAKK